MYQGDEEDEDSYSYEPSGAYEVYSEGGDDGDEDDEGEQEENEEEENE